MLVKKKMIKSAVIASNEQKLNFQIQLQQFKYKFI